MKQLEQIWNEFLALMRTKISEKSELLNSFYEMSIPELELLNIENNTVYLQTDKEFVKSIVLIHLMDDVTDAFSSICGLPVNRVEILVDESKLSQEWLNFNKHERQVRKEKEMFYNASFDNEPVSTLNPFATETAIKIIDEPSKLEHPVFFYGGSRFEQDCFLSAFIKSLQNQKPTETNFVLVNGGCLTEEIIRGIMEHDTTKYINKYKEADILIVDEIQLIFRGEVTEHELYLLLSDLVSRKKQVVLFSDFAPEQIQYHDKELCSFFQLILSVNIK